MPFKSGAAFTTNDLFAERVLFPVMASALLDALLLCSLLYELSHCLEVLPADDRLVMILRVELIEFPVVLAAVKTEV